MLELFAAATGIELGKLVLEQVLNLGKDALEDYVKDFFQDCIQTGVVRANVVKAASEYFGSNLEILMLFKDRAIHDRDYVVRDTLIRGISKYFNQEPGMFDLFCEVVKNDPCCPSEFWRDNCRRTALEALLTHYPTDPKTLELLHDRAENDPDEQLREWAQEQLKKFDRTSTQEEN